MNVSEEHREEGNDEMDDGKIYKVEEDGGCTVMGRQLSI